MADFKMHDADDNGFDAMTWATYKDRTPIYNARGCDYEFGVTSEPGNGSAEYGVVVYCYNSKNEMVWSGATGIDQDTRIIDAVRAARDSSKL